ncbi:TetR/AcrR family transcriptional regulator C-terminal domain-containing protein [Streptomyces arenae]|uniref:TetR/AcrR family transcriptional regulator C-terminal domain-containing protein n=1 Tax=Streptomyces arenae TaxID=29301 RepID=UPI00265B678A|nr:TetR/AcrR family transcriptional regulator C-terminal domain-containing protein [Streptomyces arenae]MCG7208195.1 TetR/AcrR family transcriptional regulator C-terminal domain-containing protein [Streptomyces arenae]
MATRTRRTPRRTEALSRERIVEAAVELLDSAGENGLTFRALTERLATGPGAIYWHVANKGELLGAATDAVVAAAVAGAGPAAEAGVGAAVEAGTGPAVEAGAGAVAVAPGEDPTAEPGEDAAAAECGAGTSVGTVSPQDRIRSVALGLFDAIEDHPWLATQLATQLSRSPWGPVTPRIFESVGRQVRALGVPEDGWFTATSALVHYVLGAAGQNAVNAAHGSGLGPGVDRAAFLDAVSTAWERLDPDDYPFTRAVAAQAREHDDREQFLAGIDLVLTGITAVAAARTAAPGQE